jgi:hypothetical protein
MRRNLALALALGTVLAVALAPIATATFSTWLPTLNFQFDGGVTPQTLPKHDLAPIALTLRGKVSTTDATHPSALRELTIDLDRNIAIDAKGLPICHPFVRYQRLGGLREACRSATIGRGAADFEIAFPEAAPVLAGGRVIAYNGGVHDGVTTLYAAAFINVPVSSSIVTTVQIKKIHQGRYGLRAVAKLPVVAAADGSLLDFNLELKRLFTYKRMQESYAMAKCPDGHLNADVISAIFKNEAEIPSVAPTTTFKGTVIRPCTTKG